MAGNETNRCNVKLDQGMPWNVNERPFSTDLEAGDGSRCVRSLVDGRDEIPSGGIVRMARMSRAVDFY